jgi:ABC-type dipeptide/oligopeptide/nickel transport system permease subunit
MIEQPMQTTVDDVPSLAERPSAADEADIMAAAPLSARRRFVRRFKANRGAMVAFGFIVFLLIIAVIGQWITTHDPIEQDLRNTLADPFKGGHILGTDELGRDTLSRLIVGTRVAMEAAGQAVLIAMILGVPPGLAAGYFSGFVDLVIMRITDAVQSFPPLILAISVVGILGPGLRNAMLAVGIVFAPNFLRIVRGAVLEVREETFIEASRSIGTPTLRIVRTRILPNIMPPLLVQISLASGFALLAEASLSFLGFGVQLPNASWGLMLGRGYGNFSKQPWLIVWPGVLIALTVLSFNVMGDGLRDSIGREVRREK